MLETFTHDTFAGRLGEAFLIRLDDGSSLETLLIDARTWGAGTDNHRVPFTLTFRGPSSPVLPQRIYHVENEGIGAFELFLVPIGSDPSGTRYEAVFT